MCHQTVPLSSTHALNVGLDGLAAGGVQDAETEGGEAGGVASTPLSRVVRKGGFSQPITG